VVVRAYEEPKANANQTFSFFSVDEVEDVSPPLEKMSHSDTCSIASIAINVFSFLSVRVRIQKKKKMLQLP